ncbi:MAG: serine/threonine protein kinase [Planctomycetota bacterium]|jgi:serine/threonine protein kinase
MIRLNIIRDGTEKARVFSGTTVVIGRSRSCDLTFRSAGFLSRQHCSLNLEDDSVQLEDLKSRNGVRLNGNAFHGGKIEVGDEIELGDISIELVSFGPDEDDPVQVKPCKNCGEIIPASAKDCPRCEGRVSPRKRHTLNPRQLPGYLLKSRLGAGGMGVVFEAVREEDGQTCAIKILKPHLARNPAYVMRFVEETRVLTMLRHPNIVEIYGRGSEGSLTWIDMELVDGESVRHEIRRERQLEEKRSLQIVWDMSLALDFAAKKKIIHGDVKPSNFLLDSRGGVKLCDFGLAKLFNFSNPALPGFSAGSSGKKGTAAYAAPERFSVDGSATVVADIYSMGVSLFHMLTGTLPFGTNVEARKQVDRRKIPDMHEYQPNIRPATIMLVERMMSLSIEDRHQDYRQLQDDLSLLI